MVEGQQNNSIHVVVIGASGHAKVIADTIKCSGDVVEGFLDDRDASEFPELTMLGYVADAGKLAQANPDLQFIIGIGKNKTREDVAERLSDLPYYTAIHPSAVIASDCTIDSGSAVMANAVINTGSRVGSHCIINTAATVDHNGVLEDFVHLSPGVHLSGMVSIGRGTWLGVGSAVCNNVNICGSCTIGAGAVVIEDISVPGTYIGVPAKIMS